MTMHSLWYLEPSMCCCVAAAPCARMRGVLRSSRVVCYACAVAASEPPTPDRHHSQAISIA
jgi:hypothetical protein